MFGSLELLSKHNLPNGIEGLFLELNFIKSKWPLFCTYRPPNQDIIII